MERYLCYRGVYIIEVEFMGILVPFGPSKLSVIKRYLYYRGVYIIEVEFREFWSLLDQANCPL